jgi:uncharacterized protein
MRAKAACLFAVLASITASVPGRADELTPEKRADIRSLMTMVNATGITAQFTAATVEVMVKSLKAARPDIPDRALAVVREEVSAVLQENMETPGGLVDRIALVYDRHFTHAEIKELIAFYKTSLGRRVLETLPKIANESMAEGQVWGRSLGPQVQQRIRAALTREGIELPGK